MVKNVIRGAKASGQVTVESGTGKFAGNIIKVFRHKNVIVAVDETRKLIMSIRPLTGFGF
ncbi:MAG: hypothetical protein ACQETH_11195 [Candidatus Rifleibacteriota bacterium]